MQPGLEERLIGVDISYPRDHTLIQQHCFQTSAGLCQLLFPVPSGKLERLGPQFRLLEKIFQVAAVRKKSGTAEAAHVSEAELVSSSVQGENQVRVRAGRFARRLDCQLTRHTQMEQQVHLVVQIEDDPFTPPADRSHAPAAQEPFPFSLPGLTQRMPAHGNAVQTTSQQPRPQFPDDGFNFRQLRQRTTPLADIPGRRPFLLRDYR